MTIRIAQRQNTDATATLRIAQKRDRVSTGYGPLDEALQGGYPEGYAILLSSPSCDERDLLLRRFLECDVDRCLTIYLTKDFGRVADLAATHRESFFVAVCHGSEPASDMENVVRAKGCDDLCSINIAVSSIRRRAEHQLFDRRPRKLVIDLISDVLLSRRVVITRNWLWDLVVRMKARGFTILGVLNPGMHPPEDIQAMLELFDGHISIEERESDGGPRRLAMVRKMYAYGYDSSEVELDRDVLMRPLSPHPPEPYPRPPTTPPGCQQGPPTPIGRRKNGL